MIDPFNYQLTIGIVLDGAVNTTTGIDARVEVGGFGFYQTFGVFINEGESSGVAYNSYIEDPGYVSPDCLTFIYGDTRVNTGVYTCLS